MEYGTEWEGGGGGGGGRSSRRASLTGEPSDLDFLKFQQEEALVPLKEDLADWLNKLLGWCGQVGQLVFFSVAASYRVNMSGLHTWSALGRCNW